MAEFKLGRIRFVWKGPWTASTTYYQDDVISLGGKMYLCVIGHNSQADFFSDLDITPTRWNLVSEGQTWKGDWQTSTEYIYDDIVAYGARLYIANTIHTSAADVNDGLELDQSKWDIYAEGLDWKSDWTTSTRYKINDLVKYGGHTYVCNTVHTSAATDTLGLENDQSKWDYFNQGLEYKQVWTANTRYKINDVVGYGASLWICSTAHTATSAFGNDASNWEAFVEGVQFEAEWLYDNYYQAGDIVTYGGNQYVAKRDNNNVEPPAGTDDWDLFSEGIKFLDDWGSDSSGFEYKVGELVRQGGYTYICIEDHINQQPPNATYWKRFNTGLDWRGTWADDAEYFLGDVVRFGDNSYICVEGHISEGDDGSSLGGAPNSRPDQDATGVYWNIIAVGTEQSVLTTTGDLVYYSGAAPQRLPVGLDGQVLTVSREGLPEWTFLGSADDVYYVAGHGRDEPAPIYGKSIDRPFKSIRYAAKAIEDGAKHPYSTRLVELNRKFIQREIVEFIEERIYTINNVEIDSDSIWYDFSYNTAKCERDMGLIVDALVYDLRHGGNTRSREAALSYVNDTVGSPYLTQKEQTVAAINYGLTIIENILLQTEPETLYQVLNGDNSTALVTQWTDATLETETTAYPEITRLTGIITDAITAGVATNIPAREIITSLIKVSTGHYKEVLPIIVPAETCILGDELRATNVQPRTIYNSANELTPESDVVYSFRAMQRMEDVIGDIVTGGTVTPSSNNLEPQVQEWPYAETPWVEPQVTKLVRSIKRQVDSAIGTKLEGQYTPAYDMATPADGQARDLFLLNKKFVKEEIIAYIGDQYPDINYSRTKCRKDVGFIMDAVAYDLTYGGNWFSVEAGKAYFNGNTGVLQIDGTEKQATIAAYGQLKALLQTIGRNITVTPTYQDVVEQISGTGGTAATSTKIGNLLDDIITTIEDGFDNAPAITYPTITNSDANTAIVALDAIKSDVQEEVIDFISKNFGSFTYNSAKCRRDIEYIVTGAAYDTMLGTNFNSVYNGIAYQRPNNAYNLQNQRIETVGAIRYARNHSLAAMDLANISFADEAESPWRANAKAAFDEVVDIINNGTLGTTEPGDGVADTLVFDNTAARNQNCIDAKDNLIANRDFIKAEITAWIDDQVGVGAGIWSGFTYDDVKCARDVGYLVDTMCHDVMYGGNLGTVRAAQSYFVNGDTQVYGQEAQTAAAYDRLATVLSQVVQEQSVTKSSSNLETQTTLGTPASATEAGEIDLLMQEIEDVITAGSLSGLSAITYPTQPIVSANGIDYTDAIMNDISDNILATIQYISDTYNDFNYIHAKCSRDVGLILTAAEYDFGLGTNLASMLAAYSYLRAPSVNVLKDQKAASLAAFEYARTKFYDEVPVGATYDFVRTGINDTWEWVDDIILGGSSEGGNDSVRDEEVYNAIRQLELNKDFIAEEVTSYVDEYFKDTATATTAGTDIITISDTSWLHLGMPIKFSGTTFGGVTDTTTYYVNFIASATEFSMSDAIGGANEILVTATGSMTVEKAYEYNKALCVRDVKAYIDAIKWDLEWPQEWNREYTDDISFYRPGSYKTRLAARYYINSVLGSQEEDFFYMRNGTGLRMMTMDGLRGDLTPPNKYGTSRVTAGAYASLDPGWGPDDERVWITSRSPYLQNNTTFGYAATGQKIDGALHNGGNDSMVSNDFTQVISDGIGAHILNNGRAELVSVFTYYSHIGYLAESGGRVRATNGNNSYGKFGSVAEGVDPDETAVTGVVDNRTQYRATVSLVNTDTEQLLSLEYNHAGNDYTEAVFDIFGAGQGEIVIADEFRDNAVNRVRVDEVNDSSGAAGGSGYTLVGNTAQGGGTTSINLAATDGNISSAYPGMKIYITGGAGTGLYGIIDTYNAGSKLAEVIRESDGNSGWDHIVPGTPFVEPNSTSTYQIEPAVAFTAPTHSDSNVSMPVSTSWNGVKYIETSDEYTNISVSSESDGRGVTFDVIRNGSKYYLSLNNGGTGYSRLDTVSIHGSSVGGVIVDNDITVTITTVNDVTGAVIDFDFDGVGQSGIFLAVGAGTNGATSIDGNTWSALTLPTPPAGSWDDIGNGLIYDGSSTYKVSASVIVGEGNSAIGYSEDGLTWNTTAYPAGFDSNGINKVAYGNLEQNRFLVIGADDRDIVYSDDGGQNWSRQIDALPTTGYDSLTYGAGKWVAIRSGTTDAVYSTNGITWETVVLPSVAGSIPSVTWGNGRFVIIGDAGQTFMYSLDGITWYDPEDSDGNSLTLPLSQVNYRIAYGQGVFVMVGNSAGGVQYSEDGLVWEAYNHSQNQVGGYDAIAFGNPNRNGKFITISAVADNDAMELRLGATAKGRASVANEQVFEIRITEPGSDYTTAPTITVTDPNNIDDVLLVVRTGSGALGNPTFANRGSNFITASADVPSNGSNGNADFFQNGQFVAVRRLTSRPVPGSNIEFSSLPGTFFKLVNSVSFVGTNDGSYTAFLQLSPEMSIADAPPDGDDVEMRIRFSQVRLTGHDFLDIGTGNFADTNYPGTPVNTPSQSNETKDDDGGRVFFTATDQDGNFRVGDLFSIEQATGVATLNAEAFNIAGLQELTLGEVTLGGNSAAVNEFSTDPFFTANSDSIVPTQRAVKAYIEAQIGGGGATLVVNSVTAGDVFIGTDTITTVSGAAINIKANVVFQGTVLGIPLAYNYFLR